MILKVETKCFSTQYLFEIFFIHDCLRHTFHVSEFLWIGIFRKTDVIELSDLSFVKRIFSLFRCFSEVVCRWVNSSFWLGHCIHFHESLDLLIVSCSCQSSRREFIINYVGVVPTYCFLHHFNWIEIGRFWWFRIVWECSLIDLLLLCFFWLFSSCSCSICFSLKFLFLLFLFFFLLGESIFFWHWHSIHVCLSSLYCGPCHIFEVRISYAFTKDQRCLTETSHSCLHHSTNMTAFWWLIELYLCLTLRLIISFLLCYR